MEYEDGYDDGYADGVKAAKKTAQTWTGWPGLSETARAIASQLDVTESDGYAAKFTTGSQPTFWFTAGQTLVTLNMNAEEAVDLNSLSWDNVAAAGSNRMKTSGADYIQFRNPDDDDAQIRYFWISDGGWGLQPTQARNHPELVADGQAILPAGVVFWYYRNSSAEGAASMTTSSVT